MPNRKDQTSTIIRDSAKEQVREPSMYQVILHNDHYTTQDFVVDVLRTVFHKSAPEATKIMLDVHRKGRGIVGSYTFDIARTKVDQVMKLARESGFPLKCTMEKI